MAPTLLDAQNDGHWQGWHSRIGPKDIEDGLRAPPMPYKNPLGFSSRNPRQSAALQTRYSSYRKHVFFEDRFLRYILPSGIFEGVHINGEASGVLRAVLD